MRLNSVNSEAQKITGLQIIYSTGDFNWLKTRERNNKLSEKQPKIIKHLRYQKNICVCVCMYE